MDNSMLNDYKNGKTDKELLLFDKGLNELGFNEIEENAINNNKTKKKKIDWYTLYIILFKNTLSSKNLVPKEELKLRLNIIRKYLPSYYNCQKNITENSNSNSILKKLTYHLFPKTNLMEKLILKRKNNSFFGFEKEKEKENEKEKEKEKETEINAKYKFFERRRSKTRIEKHKPNFDIDSFYQRNLKNKKDASELKVIEEFGTKESTQIKRSQIKRSTIKANEDKFKDRNKLISTPKKDQQPQKNDYMKKFEKNVKLKFDRENNELYNIGNNNKEIIIRTYNDNEYPLILSEKRSVNNNNNQTYFFDILNKLNEETKNEKINTYKKEVSYQVLKFNELYYDSKIDDFSQDNLFNEIKNTCDLFINKFNIDNQEEKNLSDLDKFL